MNARRLQILQYARDFARTHGRPPTLREIADGVGMRSVSGVHYHLQQAGRLDLLNRRSPVGR